MSDLEKTIRRRMQEEYAKGTSAEKISQLVEEIFASIDISRGFGADPAAGTRRS